MISIATAFVLLTTGLLHLHWAAGGRLLKQAAIPQLRGQPVFRPSALATIIVALFLVAASWIVAAQAGVMANTFPAGLTLWSCRALAVVFLIRGIGDFRLVGMFKSVKGTKFASWDTWLYSPLCLFLSVGCLAVTVA